MADPTDTISKTTKEANHGAAGNAPAQSTAHTVDRERTSETLSAEKPAGGPYTPASPISERDIKLAEIIGACLGSMSPLGQHALLVEAVLLHQARCRGKCVSCTPEIEARQ